MLSAALPAAVGWRCWTRPGPNEYRQPQLRKLLRDQLAKATAVLTVLDYTQLKSDADAEIRSELDAIKDVHGGPRLTRW